MDQSSDNKKTEPSLQEKSLEIVATKPDENGVWDTAIIGSGPSGFTAAIYTTRGAASTINFGGDVWGGQLMLTTQVDNWPGTPGIQGPDLMQTMKDHSTLFGGKFVAKNVDLVDFSKNPFELVSDGKTYLSRSVIIATGAETKWLGIEGEEKLRGRGVSSCAPCDAPFFKDKNVAVIGGGDSAMEEALVLAKYAKGVTIIHRKEEFRASEAMKQKIFALEKAGKVKIIWNSEVEEFLGEDKLEKLKTKDVITNNSSELLFDGAFVAIGHSPATNIFRNQVELDERGYVIRHKKNGFLMATSVDGVFVAGDVHDFHYMQAITAAAFGCMAGMEAVKYLDQLKS